MGKNEIDRRGFLKKTVMGATGALVSTSIFADTRNEENKYDDQPVIKRKLGKTGIVLPIVSYGVMRADSPALLEAARKEGIVHFDTAHGYQNGRNEEMIGEVFKNVNKEELVISTKIQPEDSDRTTGKIGPGSTSKAFLNRLDISLKRLKRDYVDILYVHGVQSRESVLYPSMIEAVTQAKKEGKAKHVGVSVHRNEPEVIRAAIESKVFEVVLASINFKQGHYAEIKKACAEAANAGIGIIAMKTMAGGFQDKERKIPINCKAALKFVLQDENVTTAIPGITNFDHLKINASVNRELILTDAEKNDLALFDNKQGGLYCQGCEKCLRECPKGLPIPDIMRAYMYAYGYNNARQSYDTLAELGLKENPCGNCINCTVKCSKNFAVSEKIADVIRVASIPQEFLA